MTYNNLPLFEAYIDSTDETGMFVVSLVDAPAVEKNFVAFKENKKVLSYSIANEEQQKVFGLIMECNKPIYRIDDEGFEYYISYSRKTIEAMIEKYFKLGLQNNVDTQHNFELEDGITLTQMLIKDTEKGVNPIGFEDVNDGSLFAEYHIENADIWNAIKEGTFKGFSLAGQFYIKEAQEVQEAFNKKENKNTNIFKMKVDKVKAMLRKLLAQFNTISTDKGTLVWDGDEDLKEGDSVHTVDEEGNEVAVEDGEYTTEDKKVITIKDGVVESIVDVETPESEEEPTEETVVEAEETESETTEEEVVEEQPNAEIEALRNEIAELRTLIDGLVERIKVIEDTPIGKSAEETFSTLKGDSKSDKMRQRGYKF